MKRTSKVKKTPDLPKHEDELREHIFSLQLKHALGQLKETSELKKTRRALAHMLTMKNTRAGTQKSEEK